MKHMKRIVSIVLAMTMVLAMGVTAFAANKTISTTSTTHTYEVYQIFTGEPDGEGGLTSLNYGSNVAKTGAVDQADIEFLNNLTDNGRTNDKLDVATIEGQFPITGTPVATLGKNGQASASLPTGYYMIMDKDDSAPEGDDVGVTLHLIKVLGDEDIVITPKADKPKHNKKVKDVNDSTGDATGAQDSADYDIGDDVPFILTATLAQNVTDYKKYHITFVDTLEAGKLKNNKDYTVKVGNTTLNADQYTIVSESDDGFEIRINWGYEAPDSNAGAIASSLNGATVTVEFTAELLEGANLGQQGNTNTSKLKYSNNPNSDDDGEPDEDETPEDTVIVFTYKVVVDKTDEAGAPLNGATFSLYKKYATAPEGKTESTEYPGYYLIDTISGANGSTFEFPGLDDGEYLLVEDEAPENYNKIDPQYFTVTATHSATADALDKTTKKDGENWVLTGLNGECTDGIIEFSHTLSETQGQLKTEVVNQSGAKLPETGGIGTTIFYVVGAMLAIGAAVVLVTKKRVNG